MTPLSLSIECIHGKIKITQLAANKLGLRRLSSLKSLKSQHYEYITRGRTANLPRVLHPQRGCGVSNERKRHKPQPVESIIERDQGVAKLKFADIDTAINNKLTSAELRLWLYLERVKPYKPTPKELAKRLGTDPRTISRAVDRLAELGLCEPPTRIQQIKREEVIRDRLQAEIGGVAEVVTPVGKIDLLTSTEIIEVKAFKDWKAALRQVLVYSGFYPKHKKRIHLFCSKHEFKRLSDIESACLSFNICVTGEVCNE